tara:strand:+ start:331 stop:981 length:651 start_codon:yes stop_codon:yes gene_type:complete
MNYQQLWTTPIGQIELDLPKVMREALIQGVISESNMDLFDYTKYAHESHIHIFKAIYRFEIIISKFIREYIAQAWGLDKNQPMLIHGLSHVQVPYQRRVEPHFHHNVDGTLIHYLTVGDEYFMKDMDTSVPKLQHDYSGDLLLLDPRPSISYPYNNKAKTIRPKVGTTIIHPGYVWHETNAHTRAGLRVALVINFDIQRNSISGAEVKPNRPLMEL